MVTRVRHWGWRNQGSIASKKTDFSLLPSFQTVSKAHSFSYPLSFVIRPLNPKVGADEHNIRVYRTIILPAVLYGCETWSLTLREEKRLRVFENRVLRRIFGRKRDEATGEWRRLHKEELNDLYSSPNIIG
jgi:hypothetical protein